MSAERTDRHQLPLLQAGQAQKEITHNEALTLIDMLTAPAVNGTVDSPPAAPLPGECWIVGPVPVGAFAGRAGALAGWTANGWRFAAPSEGMRVWMADAGYEAIWRNAAWTTGIVAAREFHVDGQRVIGARAAAIERPSGGISADAEARTAIDTIIAALEAHGLIATG